MSVVLGVSAYHGDAAAAVLVDGALAAAVEEERFARIKHWAGFPRESILSCLEIAGVKPADVERIAIGRRPRAHLARRALFALRRRPGLAMVADRARSLGRVHAIAAPLAEALGLERARVERRIAWVEHHRAHAASAFFASPFETAAVAAIDGFGDFVSTSWALGQGTRLRMLRRVYFPHSLGMLYLALTQYLGFPAYGDEYKVMGLAAYGEPEHADRVRRLVRLTPGGGFALDQTFFRHATTGVAMTWDGGEPTIGRVYTPALETLLGPARAPDAPVEPRHQNVAASLQAVFEEAVYHVLRALHAATGERRLCLAGGAALNGVANGKIARMTPFEEIWVPPVAADAGTALGAALDAHHRLARGRSAPMVHAYWGPEFSPEAIAHALAERAGDLARERCRVETIADEDALCRRVAAALADGRIVGWFQGRMELGARALGNRSILADPRRAEMREVLNEKVKLRERFRPFAPSILEDAIAEYFDGAAPDPFMTRVYPVRPEKRAVIPAVVHVDGTGRLHTVTRAANPRYWRLIRAFADLTGVPVLLNTSFNEREPIVHRPAEALDCFLRTGLDVLVLGDTTVTRGAS